MSTIKSSAENLTLNADGSNNDIILQSNGSTKVTLDGQNSRLGIGTTSPSTLVHIKAASGAKLRVEETDGSYGELEAGGNGMHLVAKSGGYITLRPNTTEAVRILSDGKVGIGTTNPAKPLHVAATGGFTARFESSATETGIEIYNSTNSHIGYLGFSDPQDNSGGWKYNHSTNRLYSRVNGSDQGLSIDSTGAVTMPLQPAFQAHLSANQDDLAINGAQKIEFDTERFDNNADFNTSTNTFTAPVTGKYVLGFTLSCNAPDAAAGFYQFYLGTSNRSYTQTNTIADSTDPTYWTFAYSIVADMDASDTAAVNMYQNAGTAQMDIRVESEFYGYLLG